MKNYLLLILAFFFAGCASSSVSSVSRISGTIPAGQIGMAPGGSEFADAIATELFQRGFDIVDSVKVQRILITNNATEISIMRPDSLEKLNQQGIKTLLIVKGVGGYDALPQSATVRLVSTETGEMITSVNWQNGYGGRATSIADRMMRADVATAAKQIVDELSKKLSK